MENFSFLLIVLIYLLKAILKIASSVHMVFITNVSFNIFKKHYHVIIMNYLTKDVLLRTIISLSFSVFFKNTL
jgi:hypothetical protein